MSGILNKQKLISALIQDIKSGEKQRDAIDLKNPRMVIGYFICNDEMQYIQSLIDTIESGTYDEVP